ncbi:uncharacterized protein LOC131597814 [Vicia villosa]|uniref:uncharacterized protein LOC131597814 n=1 Tax=Vicia villosa TaxID=3911 RepID=UPI00273B9A2E|nr:uncharacterized protein LOC131597814 [Vicia villosa]
MHQRWDRLSHHHLHMSSRSLYKFEREATPLMAGIAVAAAAYAGKAGIQAWQAFKARRPALRKFYEGGFQPTMTRREAALILGVRYFHFCFLRFEGIDCMKVIETIISRKNWQDIISFV